MIFSLTVCRGQGMGIMIITSCLCCSFLLRESLLLLQHGVPTTGGSHPWTSQMCVLPMGYSSSSQHEWVTGSWLCPANLLQGELLSVGVHRSCQTCSSVSCPVSHPLHECPPALARVCSVGSRWISAPPLPPWPSGTQLPHHDLCSSSWSTSCPSFTDCEYASHIFSLLYLGCTGPGQHGDNSWHLLPEALPGRPCYQALVMQMQCT